MLSEVDLWGGYRWTSDVATAGSYLSFGTAGEVFRSRGYAVIN